MTVVSPDAHPSSYSSVATTLYPTLVDGNLITNQQSIANYFNNNFLTVADRITSNIKNDKISLNRNNPIHCLYKNFKLPCSNMKIKYTTPKEIKK